MPVPDVLINILTLQTAAGDELQIGNTSKTERILCD